MIRRMSRKYLSCCIYFILFSFWMEKKKISSYLSILDQLEKILFSKTNINFVVLCRYGGWSFGLTLTNDLRFDIAAVPVNRTLAKVNLGLSSGGPDKYGCEIDVSKHFHVRNTKHLKYNSVSFNETCMHRSQETYEHGTEWCFLQ